MKIEINKEENFVDVWNEEEQIWDRYIKVSIPVTAEEKKIPEKLILDIYATIGTEVDKDVIIKINEIIDYLKTKGE